MSLAEVLMAPLSRGPEPHALVSRALVKWPHTEPGQLGVDPSPQRGRRSWWAVTTISAAVQAKGATAAGRPSYNTFSGNARVSQFALAVLLVGGARPAQAESNDLPMPA